VRLHPDGFFSRDLLAHSWGESWGIYVVSGAQLSDLQRHFRRFLRVQDESGKTLIFRYYDPRVLRPYLPTCTPAELQTVFGPVTRFVLEGRTPNVLLDYRRDDRGGLLAAETAVEDAAGAGAPAAAARPTIPAMENPGRGARAGT
jgi:hypothetical protein